MAWIQSPTVVLVFVSACLLISSYLYRQAAQSKTRNQGLPLPPGPPRLPLVGNLFDIPKVAPWRKYQEFCQKYGDIISLQAMGRTLVIIDKLDVAIDLIEKHSAVYSSRPRSPLTHMVGLDWNMALMPYGQDWRHHRRIFWQHFHPNAVSKYVPSQEKGAHDMLVRLLSGSGKVDRHLRYTLGSSIIQAAYGLDVAPADDKVISTFEEGNKCVDLLLSGASILEFLPALGRIPTWLPGARLQRRLAYYRRMNMLQQDLPWEEARAAMRGGKSPQSIASAMIESLSHPDAEADSADDIISKGVLAAAYTAGIDTQHSALTSFFVAMSLHPEVQEKARAELDAVVGSGRLPRLADREALPYVNAIVKETLRWHTVAPFGIAHSSTADGVYDGYFIPEDALIIVNIWSILHDPEKYPQPEEFIPERFLKDGKLDSTVEDPAEAVFGFGRRICPGRYFANTSLFLYISYVLHTFEIRPPLDDEGQPIRIQPQATSGIISYIEDCRCVVQPRSASAEQLIRGIQVEVS